jgi:ribose transport system permease protein
VSQESVVRAETPAPVPRSDEEGGKRKLGISVFFDYGIVIAFAALFITLSIASNAFLTTTNLLNILNQNAPLAIIACGGTLVIIAGGFDLSVGAIFALSGVVAAKVTNATDPLVGLAVGLMVGVVCGLANGLIVTYIRVNTFIGTLATGYVFRGIATLVTSAFLVSVADPDFTILGQYSFEGVDIAIWVFVIVAVALTVVLNRTTFGRYIFAVGGNPEAARLSGVRVNFVRAATFVISGTCAALAGLIAASKDATGQAQGGIGFELTAIAAIVVGGTSIAGGEGAIWRSVLGILLIALIGNGFNLLNIDPFYQSLVQGLIILIAVGLDVWARASRAAA